MKNVFEKISGKMVSEIEFDLLYKIIAAINDDRLVYNANYHCYESTHYVITVTKKRAYATPLYKDYYFYSIRPCHNLSSI